MNLVSENYFNYRLFARALNEASRDVMVRSFTAIWAVILFSFPRLTSSLEYRRRHAIFGFYGAYSFIPLFVRLYQEYRRRDIVLMEHRELGTLDRETGRLTPMLFRSANADTILFYMSIKTRLKEKSEKYDQKVSSLNEKIESIIEKSAVPTENNGDIKILCTDVAFLAYTYYETKLHSTKDDREELLRMLVMFLSCIYHENQSDSDWTRENFQSRKCVKKSSVHTFYLRGLDLTTDTPKAVPFLGLFLARENCNIVALE
eukprot:CAMPEP_0204876836 /NCGR_PEP_ID=MMETSP1348-20121228/47860_1 /ASSEMBLY_ACC=CAM_ASM_000700 /TAXON_ID=215587 /ORGANISM="Aplanochytrium stocchinoi, Strain GSBS06" /LENGTH=259 /DNA_ID=CAMNT_0052033643 /DNA_START=586 /DNA_END=1365 /DNA_ORIENTATION=+